MAFTSTDQPDRGTHLSRAIEAARAWMTDGSDRSRAQRAAGAAFLIRVASAALLYVSQVLFARWMGSFEFGVYVYVWTWVLLLGGLVDLGIALGIEVAPGAVAGVAPTRTIVQDHHAGVPPALARQTWQDEPCLQHGRPRLRTPQPSRFRRLEATDVSGTGTSLAAVQAPGRLRGTVVEGDRIHDRDLPRWCAEALRRVAQREPHFVLDGGVAARGHAKAGRAAGGCHHDR